MSLRSSVVATFCYYRSGLACANWGVRNQIKNMAALSQRQDGYDFLVGSQALSCCVCDDGIEKMMCLRMR